MRLGIFIACMVLFLAQPALSGAAGVEMAVGGWYQEPEGDIAYKPLTGDDILGVERDLRYDEEIRLTGRLKVDVPGPFPNLYLMATSMRFDGMGQKNVDFIFGDLTFSANVDFSSKVNLDHYDIALYYGIPGIKQASAGKFNVELGVNVRIVDFEAEVSQAATGFRESESFILPVPMAYLGAQIEPVEWLAIEAEARGLSIGNDHIYSVIGRVKVRPAGPLFIAAGWRYEDVDIDEDDVKADVEVGGPFAEVGLEF